MRLNEAYVAIRGQTLLINLLPTINRAHFLIFLNEKQRDLSKGIASLLEVIVFAVRKNSHNSEKSFTLKNSHIKYGMYNKLGHTSEKY